MMKFFFILLLLLIIMAHIQAKFFPRAIKSKSHAKKQRKRELKQRERELQLKNANNANNSVIKKEEL